MLLFWWALHIQKINSWHISPGLGFSVLCTLLSFVWHSAFGHCTDSGLQNRHELVVDLKTMSWTLLLQSYLSGPAESNEFFFFKQWVSPPISIRETANSYYSVLVFAKTKLKLAAGISSKKPRSTWSGKHCVKRKQMTSTPESQTRVQWVRLGRFGLADNSWSSRSVWS